MAPWRMHRYWHHDFRIIQSTDMFLLFPHYSLPVGYPYFIPISNSFSQTTYSSSTLRVSILYVLISPEPKHQDASLVSGLSRAQLVFCQALPAASSALGQCEPSAVSLCLHCSTIHGVTHPTSPLTKPHPTGTT